MATKKYLSPNSFIDTITDNFRKMMGQYFYINDSSKLVYGEDKSTLDPSFYVDEMGVPNPVPTDVLFRSDSSPDVEKTLQIMRTTAPVADWDGPDPLSLPYLEYGLYSHVDSPTHVNSYADGHKKSLYLRVWASSEDYPTMAGFSSDMNFIFQNDPSGEFLEESFTYESLNLTSENVSIQCEYNFFNEQFERTMTTIPETSYPNFYALATVADKGARGVYEDIKENALLFGRVDVDLADSTAFEKYFDEWPSAYVSLTSDEVSSLDKRSKNIIFPVGRKDTFIEDLSESDESFASLVPYYIHIRFPAEDVPSITNKHGDTIATTHLTDNSPEYYLNREETGAQIYGIYDSLGIWSSHLASCIDPETALVGSLAEDFALGQRQYYRNEASEVGDGRVSVRRGFDYLAATAPLVGAPQGVDRPWLNDTNSVLKFVEECNILGSEADYDLAGDSSELTFALDKKLIIGTLDDEECKIIHDLELDFETTAASLVSKDYYDYGGHQLRIHFTTPILSDPGAGATSVGSIPSLTYHANNIHENSSIGRTYKEAFEDYADKAADSFNETVIYRIAKHKGEDTATEPIQNIWIHNKDRRDFINYIDTQVKYGETYTYKIYAYKYVFGMKYNYRYISGPRIEESTTVIDGEEVLGYTVTWTGAYNLFDDFAEAGTTISERGLELQVHEWIPVFNELAGLDDPEYDADELLFDMASATRYPVYRDVNQDFFTVDQIRDIMRLAWYIVPAGGEFYSKSWQDIWGTVFDDSWFDDIEFEGGENIQDALVWLGSEDDPTRTSALSRLDPANFSIRNWITLFFGDSNRSPMGLGGEHRTQGLPPSHHVLWFGLGEGVHYGLTCGLETESQILLQGPFDPLGEEVVEAMAARHGSENGIQEVVMGDYSVVETTGYASEYAIDMDSSTKIVEVPYLTLTGAVVSKPPIAPEVSIVPYRAVNNELLFSFEAPFTKREELPVFVTGDDEELFSKQYAAQGKLEGEALTFEVDDVPAGYQLFRLSRPPASYADFADSLRATASTLISLTESRPVRSTSVSYRDKLRPNVKYYYMFRTVDFHGNVSNPSVVYEIELVDDGGAIYPLINTYNFPTEEATSSEKQMKKVIQIIPTLEQSVIDPAVIEGVTDPNDVTDIRLGSDSLVDTVWDKKFKIRLTSNDTGKKIDLNIDFDLKDERGVAPVVYDPPPAAPDRGLGEWKGRDRDEAELDAGAGVVGGGGDVIRRGPF